ncbi:MAG: hypothetical protein K9H64_10505 [Bacteroidales bacterium]|nr:hypothetical protein [Bacteroidales bacterium]MCF8456334.1 hypothetical protein [Bacteroidales bacterium]
MKKLRHVFGKHYPILLVLLFIFTNCKKEIEPVALTYEPGLAVALAHAQLSLADLIPDDDPNFAVGQDGSISFIYREDSILSYSVDDLFEIPNQEEEVFKYKLGEIALNNFGPITAVASLDDLTTVIDTADAAAIQALDGTTNNLPAIVSTYEKRFDFDDFEEFEYVTFSDGWLILGAKNNIPVTFASAPTSLYTIDPMGDSTLVGVFTFTNLEPGIVQIDSIPLAGLTLYNDFMIILNSFETYASAGPVLVNLSDGIYFELNSYGVKVIAGKGKIPAQDLDGVVDSTELSAEGNERLTLVALNQASLHYSVESFIDLDASLSLELPAVTQNGVPFSFQFDASQGSSGSLDLSNSIFDLTTNPLQPYNFLPVVLSLQLAGSDTWVEFDSSLTVILKYEIDSFSFDLVQGWIGVKELSVGPDTVDFNFSELANISGSIYLADPMFHLIVDNNIGLPVDFSVDLINRTNEGLSQSLLADPFHFPYPFNPGEEIIGEIVTIDNSNSQLSEFLSVFPDRMVMGGGVVTNPDSVNTGVVYSNFVTSDGRVNIGLEFELPLSFSIQNLQFVDTVDFSIDDNLVEDAFGGHLSIVAVNGIPFETSLQLDFVDTTNFQVFDTYLIDLLEAAPVDANGKVTSTVTKVSKIEMDTDRFNSLKNANKIILKALVNTSSSSTGEAVFYSDYTLDVRVGILVNYSYDIN